mmetsp:Transcript_10396/g.32893  ORF Transcript_10396/g.32893 Transcript_10396/m.32893 type:complete len:449 (-) Transcript_10396:1563-2909(-)
MARTDESRFATALATSAMSTRESTMTRRRSGTSRADSSRVNSVRIHFAARCESRSTTVSWRACDRQNCRLRRTTSRSEALSMTRTTNQSCHDMAAVTSVGMGYGRCVGGMDRMPSSSAVSKVAEKVKVEPTPGFDDTPTRPPIMAVSCLEMYRPRPVPPNSRVVDSSTCVNSLNSFACPSLLIPMPVSFTANSRYTGSRISSTGSNVRLVPVVPSSAEPDATVPYDVDGSAVRADARVLSSRVRWPSVTSDPSSSRRRTGRSANDFRDTCTTTAPCEVNLMALLTRLCSTWRRRVGSPTTTMRKSGGTMAPSSMPLSAAAAMFAPMTKSTSDGREKGIASRDNFPFSILVMSRTSLTSVSSILDERAMPSTYFACWAFSRVSCRKSLFKITPANGFRISCDMIDTNRVFASDRFSCSDARTCASRSLAFDFARSSAIFTAPRRSFRTR